MTFHICDKYCCRSPHITSSAQRCPHASTRHGANGLYLNQTTCPVTVISLGKLHREQESPHTGARHSAPQNVQLSIYPYLSEKHSAHPACTAAWCGEFRYGKPPPSIFSSPEAGLGSHAIIPRLVSHWLASTLVQTALQQPGVNVPVPLVVGEG